MQQYTLKGGNRKMDNKEMVTYSISLEYLAPHINSCTIPVGKSMSFQIKPDKRQDQALKEQYDRNIHHSVNK